MSVESASLVDVVAKYASPVNPAAYPMLALVLMTSGVFFLLWFLVYVVRAHSPCCVLRVLLVLPRKNTFPC